MGGAGVGGIGRGQGLNHGMGKMGGRRMILSVSPYAQGGGGGGGKLKARRRGEMIMCIAPRRAWAPPPTLTATNAQRL